MPGTDPPGFVAKFRALRIDGGVQRILKAASIDRAVFFALATRLWQLLTGPLTLMFIARFFTPETQGFYYTFAGLLALQVLFELGLSVVIVNVASHEWAKLNLTAHGEVEGDSSALARLTSFGRLLVKWYGAASALFFFVVGTAGYFFLAQSSTHTVVQWQKPWWALVAATSILLWMLPFNSLLEGCNQVAVINRFRLSQAMMSTLALWGVLVVGGGLWAPVASTSISVLRDLLLVGVQYRRFFAPFLRRPVGTGLDWWSEVWPMQWRLGAQGMVNYFMNFLFTPVVFHYHGASAAGQIGMTWQLTTIAQSMALSWVVTRGPRFGMLIARKQYEELDRIWKQTTQAALCFLLLACGGILSGIWVLNTLSNPLARRLLTPGAAAWFFCAAPLTLLIQCQATYLRAFKREPFLKSGVVSGVLTGLLVVLLGKNFGAGGAAAAYFLVTAFVALPWVTVIWLRSRKSWQLADAGAPLTVADPAVIMTPEPIEMTPLP
jgi:O-antigen/teichoic acid export membrane protein